MGGVIEGNFKLQAYLFFTSSLITSTKLWKKYDWEEIIQFCHTTYNGLNLLEDIAKRERNLYYSRKSKE